MRRPRLTMDWVNIPSKKPHCANGMYKMQKAFSRFLPGFKQHKFLEQKVSCSEGNMEVQEEETSPLESHLLMLFFSLTKTI